MADGYKPAANRPEPVVPSGLFNMSSPYKSAPDSPSRQLLWELAQISISAQQNFQAHLDRENEEREGLHTKALAAAAAKHDRVRRSVDLERQRLDLAIQAERDRREAETIKEVERQRREKTEREIEERKREIERAQAIAAEEKRKEELNRRVKEASEARIAQQQQQADAARKAKEQQDAETRKVEEARAAEARAREKLLSAQNAREPSAALSALKTLPTLTNGQASTSAPQTTIDPQREAEHEIYLTIHKRLKELRKHMTAKAREIPELKKVMGDMRRELKKCVGQLTDVKGANKVPLQAILTILKKAAATTEPTVPVPPFLANPPNPLPQTTTGPALLFYLLNIFAKAILAQFIDEAGVSPKAADPVGIIASHIFAVSEFRWNGLSLIDILLAKLHLVCPVLFGIHGPEITPAGKARLGWSREEPNGPFISQQRHYERMTGLGSGFAALSLRNYEKAKVQNPFPDHHYWRALAAICNTPGDELTPTHFVVLKGMIENYEGKFIHFFGGAAVAALRVACVELPGRARNGGVAAKGVGGLVDVMRRDRKIAL